MQVKRFIANSTREALNQVKSDLGPDAIILANRNMGGGQVEILATASSEMAALVTPAPAKKTPEVKTTPVSQRPKNSLLEQMYSVSDETEDYVTKISAPNKESAPLPSRAYGQASQLQKNVPASIQHNVKPHPDFVPKTTNAPVSAKHQEKRAEKKEDTKVIPPEVMEEIRSLRKMMEEGLVQFAWKSQVNENPNKMYTMQKMLELGFSPKFCREMLADLPMGLDMKSVENWVVNSINDALMTASQEDDIIKHGGIYALVGPTGVGKTTTLAKLASKCVLKHGPSKVVLITTDSYRIGAYEQLKIYARILGIQVHPVKNENEMQNTLHELRGKHLVLIDTMGMSHRDKMLPDLHKMIADPRIKKMLLLAATYRADTMDEIVRSYSTNGIEGCILTKVDEASGLSSAMDVLIRHNLVLHFISNGQRVPEDLHLPNRKYLSHQTFKNFSKVEFDPVGAAIPEALRG